MILKNVKSWLFDDNVDIYITGSNSNLWSSDIANELGGRYIEFTIYSLSYLEFLQFHKRDNDEISLERLILFLAGNIGNLFSSKSIHDDLKSNKIESSVNQTMEYINALTEAFIIHKVGRFDIVGKKVFERGEKYYFTF